MRCLVMVLLALGSSAAAVTRGSFMGTQEDRFVLPLKAIPLPSSDVAARFSFLSTQHRSLLAEEKPLFLESEASAGMKLRNFFNSQYVGTVKVGTPPQAMDVILDTGSANFWINSRLCEEDLCTALRSYDHEKSDEYEELGYFVEVTFGTGQLDGEINADTVELAGIRIQGQRFGEITDMDGDVFEDAKFSGILGLAFPSMAAFGFQPVFDSMMESGLLPSNVFTFYYSLDPKEESQLSFGAIDQSKYEGDIVWVNVIDGMQYYWLIEIDSVRLGDIDLHLCPKGCHAAVDTGTTLLAAPSSDTTKMLYTLNLEENCTNFQDLPDLIIRIGGKDFPIPPNDYILTMDSYGEEDPPALHSEEVDECTIAVMPMDIGKPYGPLWVLGDIFLANYYTVFDRDNERVGFAKSKHGAKD